MLTWPTYLSICCDLRINLSFDLHYLDGVGKNISWETDLSCLAIGQKRHFLFFYYYDFFIFSLQFFSSSFLAMSATECNCSDNTQVSSSSDLYRRSTRRTTGIYHFLFHDPLQHGWNFSTTACQCRAWCIPKAMNQRWFQLETQLDTCQSSCN